MTVLFSRVPPSLVNAVWKHAAPLLGMSFRRLIPGYDLEDLREWCADDICQLWIGVDGNDLLGAVVTTLQVQPKAKTCVVIHLGGVEIERWIQPMLDAGKQFARDNGCASIEMVARKGFTQHAPEMQEDGILYIIPLTES